MKRILLLAALAVVSLGGCVSTPNIAGGGSSPPFVVPLEKVYSCIYKYDARLNIVFRESDRAVYHPPSLPSLTVYHITDTKGKRWSINQYEWLDYTCTVTKTAIRNKVK